MLSQVLETMLIVHIPHNADGIAGVISHSQSILPTYSDCQRRIDTSVHAVYIVEVPIGGNQAEINTGRSR